MTASALSYEPCGRLSAIHCFFRLSKFRSLCTGGEHLFARRRVLCMLLKMSQQLLPIRLRRHATQRGPASIVRWVGRAGLRKTAGQ